MYSRRQFLNSLAIGGAAASVLIHDHALANVKDAIKSIDPHLSPEEIAKDEIFWSRIQSSFMLDRSIVHFNNGGICPSPRAVHDVFKRYLDYANQGPSYYMWQHLSKGKDLIREKIAKAFGCTQEEIALTRNTTESIMTVQFGLDLKEGDEVIDTSQVFFRMDDACHQLERRNKVVIKKVKIPVPLMNPDDYVNQIKNAITKKTKAIICMHVVNYTGQIIPIKKVTQIAHAHNIPVIVDGAHAFNHFPFKQKDLGCDFYGTSFHKWTYGPVGAGFLYIKKERIKDVWPLFACSPETDVSNIKKFENYGTSPTCNVLAVGEALAFNEGIGIDRKAARLRYLHSRWLNRIRNYDNVKFMVNIDDPTQWCGLITMSIEGIDRKKLADYLMNKHKIFVTSYSRDEFEGIRVTPNIYSLLSEVDYFGDVIEKVVKGEIKEVMKS